MRCVLLPQACSQGDFQPSNTLLAPFTRRNALLGASVSALIFSKASRPVLAEESTAAPVQNIANKPWASFIDREFSFNYPSSYMIIENNANDFEPRSTLNAQRKMSPIKAELRSMDGTSYLNVISKQSAMLKQTLFQVTNITQLGDVKDVARLFFPAGTTIVSCYSKIYEQPATSTKSPLGVIRRDPIVIYRYSVKLADGSNAELAIGARLGQLFILGAGSAAENWEDIRGELSQIADSFKIILK